MTNYSSVTSDYIWDYWTSGISSGTYDTSYSSNYVWSTWITSTDTSTTSSTYRDSYVWGQWISVYTDKVVNPQDKYSYYQEERTPEQIEAERKRIEESQKQYKKMQEEKEAAEEKAQILLGELIGEEQLQVYKKTGRVFVKGKKFDYIIQKTGYVKRIEKDKIRDLCIHLKDKYQMPETDNVVALKCFLEADEYAFNEMANEHSSYPLSEKPREAACM